MTWIIQSALRFRVLVVILALLLLVLGQQLLPRSPLDVFPEFAPPLVEIQTEAPGLSTEDVESLVTVPIENAVNGIAWMTAIRSKSVMGLSSVQLILERGVDLMVARQLVQERLTAVSRDLPSVVGPPVILSPLSSTSRVLKVGMQSDRLTQVELSTAARWTIRPRLLGIPGVANVAIWGQRDRELQVLVDPDRLQALGVGLGEVVRAAGAAVTVGGGGFISTPNQQIAVDFHPSVRSAADLGAMVVAQRDAGVLLLRDVATIAEGNPIPIGDAIINDVPGILLIVEKQPWGNTLQVTHAVEAALDELRPALDGIEIDSTIFRPATFIEISLANLRRALLIGAVLVAGVLGLFLFEWRTALISLTAIPLSLVAAALVLRYQGGSIDTMVLAGLIIALGEVVDDAIIDVENIFRRLRLERSEPNPRPLFAIVLGASLEVRSAVVYASLIVAIVLVPVMLLPGLSGAFFQPLAFAYVLAILASLAVALTVTPALCLLLLPRVTARNETHRESPVVRWLKRRYQSVLDRMLSGMPAATVLAVAGIAGLAAWPLLGRELLPDFKEYDFLMHWVEKPGTSLDAMDRITVRASRELRSVPGVRNFGSHIGRAEVADEVVGPNFAELWISLDPGVDYDATVATVQEIVDGYPGLYRDLLTYLRERIKEVLTGASATIVVRIFGDDLPTLLESAERVREVMSGIDGVSSLHVEQQTLIPQLQVRLRPDALAMHGLTSGDVQSAIEIMLRGRIVGQLFQDQKIFDVTVIGTPRLRGDPIQLGEITVETPGGGAVPLRDLADIGIRPAPNTIKRDRASRRIDVTCNVSERALSLVARDVETRVGALALPAGVHAEFLGEFAEQQAASRRLAGLALLSLVGVFALLQAGLASVRLATLVFSCLPVALVGGIAVVALSGGVVSLGSLVGFVTVLGIAARNSLMLVSHFLHLENEEGMAFGRALVIRGAQERLAPILMTALTTGLALLPIVLGGSQPGYEIERPMALVILGGLATSTGINLLLLPGLYLRWGR